MKKFSKFCDFKIQEFLEALIYKFVIEEHTDTTFSQFLFGFEQFFKGKPFFITLELYNYLSLTIGINIFEECEINIEAEVYTEVQVTKGLTDVNDKPYFINSSPDNSLFYKFTIIK